VDASLPGLDLVLNRLVTTIFDARPANAYEAEINRAMERALVVRLMTMAESAPSTQVRAIATAVVQALPTRSSVFVAGAGAQTAANYTERAHRQLLLDDIKRFLDRPYTELRPAATPAPPPGAPIGDFGLDYLLGLDMCLIR
jgi:hypothetical protein